MISDRNPAENKHDPAFQAMAFDVLGNVLSLADNPGELSRYITHQIREMTGARIVILIQCLQSYGETRHRTVSVSPDRHRKFADSPEVNRLVRLLHQGPRSPMLWNQETAGGEVKELLTKLGCGLSIGVPLNVGDIRVGVLLLLDILDRSNISALLDFCDMLSTVVALVFRNSLLFEKQEEIIKKRTQELQKSEKSLIEAQRIAHLGNWDRDLVKNELRWSDEIYRIFGLEPQEFEATYEVFLNTVHPEDRELVKKAIKDALQERKPYSIDHRIILPSGIERIVHEQAEVTFDEAGTPVRMIGTVQDITERKQTEEAIQKKSDVLEAINKVFLETLVCETEEEVAYTCINMAERLTGSKYGLIGEINEAGCFDTLSYGDLGWAICKMPESEAIALSKNMEIRGVWAQAILQEKTQIINDPASHPARVGIPENHPKINSFMGVPLQDGGRTIGMIGLANKEGGYDSVDQEAVESLSIAFMEALRRKRAEEELKKHREHLEELVEERTAELAVAKEQAEAADRLKSAFLATMSHELRTPLNSIIGFTGIILQGMAGPLNDEQTKQLEMVLASARHLLSLINDVLDISKIEAGQLDIVSKPFDMRQAIEKVVHTVTPLAEKKKILLVCEVAPQVHQIVSDQRRVEQIIINLLNNAIKFTEKGKVRIECQVDGGWLVTRVVDTGIGIKPEDMGKLFKVFQQIDTKLGRQHEGTGLGLSICKKLVEMLGGEIRAESQWGVGSTFTFTLPIKQGGGDETQDSGHR